MSDLLFLFLVLYFSLSLSSTIRILLYFLLAVYLLKDKKLTLLCLLLAMIARTCIDATVLHDSFTGIVTQSSHSSFQMITLSGKIQVYSNMQVQLDELVSVKGQIKQKLDIHSYTATSSVRFSINDAVIRSIYKPVTLRNVIDLKIQKEENEEIRNYLYLILLHQGTSDFSQTISILLMIYYFKKLLKKLFYQQTVERIETGMVLLFAYLFAQPFVVVRAFFFKWIRRFSFTQIEQLGCFSVLLFLYDPYFCSTSSFWFVFLLRLMSLGKRTNRIQFISLISGLQLCFTAQCDLFECLFYGLHQILSTFSFFLCAVYLFVPIPLDLWMMFLKQINSMFPDFALHGSFSLLFLMTSQILLTIFPVKKQILITVTIILLIHFIGINPISRVVFLNVGQGDCILIHSPVSDVTILIDTGPPSSWRQLRHSLYAHSVYEIDLLILTHDDADHTGNKDQLLSEFDVKEVIDKDSKNLSDTVYGLTQINELHYQTDNENSLVYTMKINGLTFLFAGDAEQSQEIEFSEKLSERMNVCKIAHHGSNTSTSWKLLDHAGCDIAILSAGLYNKYNHPHEEVIERLNLNGSKIFNTQFQGDIQVNFLRFFHLVTTSNHEFVIIDK